MVRNADRIFVLDDGGIAEAGPHEALPGQNGRGASLVRS
jgi:ABC-type multidrug transport system fused ATPase/permease subunit